MPGTKFKTVNQYADYVTEKTRRSTLTVLRDEKDSAVIDMLILLTDAGEGHNGLFGMGESVETQSAKLNEMRIRVEGDTSAWYFIPSLIAPKIGNPSIDYFGKLVKGEDTISIIYAKGFKNMEKMWKGYPTGLLFIKDSRQIAALQYERGYYVWLTTLGEEEIKIMLGSFMTAYISGVQN
jgi:hypothetical protein